MHDQATSLDEEIRTGGCQREALPTTVEQVDSERTLEGPHLATERRRRDVYQLSGASDRPFLSDYHEVAQQIEVDHPHSMVRRRTTSGLV